MRDIFEFGEFLLIKNNDWLIHFRCKYCDRVIDQLKTFLEHALSHLLDTEKLPSLIDGILTADEQKNCMKENNIELVTGEFKVAEVHDKNDEIIIIPENKLISEEVYEHLNSDLQLHQESIAGNDDCSIANEQFEIEFFEILPKPNEYDTRKIDKNSLIAEKQTSDTINGNMRNAASNEPILQCTYCKRKFLKNYLKTHMLIHSREKKYSCDICGAKFSQSSNYKVHYNRHLGIKPHQCKICPKSFATTTDLQAHMRSHTDDRPFICDICGLTYKSQIQINTHIRHKHVGERNFSCDVCDKKFLCRASLKDHQIGHIDVRPFKCDICNNCFKRRKSLKEHKKLHTDIHKYKCMYCEKAFQQSPGLHAHLKNAHKFLK